VERLLEQVEEDPMPGQQAGVRVLHVHLGVDVDELAQRPVVVDHAERAEVPLLLRLRQGSLVLAMTEDGKQPAQVLQVRQRPKVRLHQLRERHRLREDGQVAQQERITF
jgi:hypothetical protein